MEHFLPWGEFQRVACFVTPGKPFSLSGPQFSHLSKKGFELGQQIHATHILAWIASPGGLVQTQIAGPRPQGL